MVKPKADPPSAVMHEAVRLWLVFGLIALAFLYPRHDWKYYSNVNEVARIYLVQAIVDHGVLHIDHGIAAFGDVIDKAQTGDHTYCDKPIGLSLAAVPFYAAIKAVGAVSGHIWTLEELRYLLTICCVSLPSILAIVWLRKYWKAWTGDALLADFAVLAYGLGTMAFTYSTQFMGHQIAAALAVAHFAVSRRLHFTNTWPRLLAAGALTGFGALTEYYSLFLHLLIGLTYVRRLRSPVNAAGWFTAVVVSFSPLLIYNSLCFGGPFQMAYGHEAAEVFRQQHGTGFFGVTYPRFESIWGLLFSGRKGLLYLSPILALAIFALPALRRGDSRRSDVALFTACTTVIMLLAMSVHNWLAGLTVGPRHMVAMLPFMMGLVVEGLRRLPRMRPWAIGLSLVGIAFVAVATLTMPAFAWDLENPVATQAFFLAARGYYSPNIGHTLGLPGAWSLAPLLIMAGVVVASIIVSMYRASRLIVSPASLSAVAMAVAWILAVAFYEPDPPVIRTLFQGRVLGFVGQLNESATRLEQALDMMPTPQILQETAPQLFLIYRELGNTAAEDRLKRRIAEIEAKFTQ